MTAPNFIAFEFLTAADLNLAFSDCVSLSQIGTQTLASTINLPQLLATISIQTEQMIVTGDLVLTGSSAISMPVGSTVERPNVPVFGMVRGNSDSGLIEVLLQSGNWANVVTTAAVSTPTNPPVSMAGPAFGQPTSSAIPLGWVAPAGGTGPFSFSVQYRLAGTANWITWIAQTEAFSTTVSGLLPAARYEFQLTAFNSAGTATSPVVATNTIGFLAGGPTNVTASQPTSTTMALTWLGIASSPVAYQVQFAAQGASSWSDYNGPTTNTSATVTNLIPNTTYNFQVIAKTVGSQVESLVAQGATTAAATIAPNAATGLTSSSVNVGGFTLSWQPPSAGTQPMSYQAQYELNGTGSFANYGPATTQTSVTFANLNSSSGYNVQIVSTNSAGYSTSTPLPVTTSTASAATGSVGGSENSGPNYPQIIAPSVASVVQGSAIALTGISFIDPIAIYSPGTLVLKVSCGSGSVTMTDANGNQVAGSGTNSISYSSTFTAVQTAMGSLVYTATTPGTDNVSVTVTDQLIQTSTLAIPVAVMATAGGAPPSPPPGGGGSGKTTTGTGQPTDVNGTQATQSRAFTNGIGINVRLEDIGYNGNYTLSQAAVIENMINYCGGGYIALLREQCGLNMNDSWIAQVAQNCGLADYVLCVSGSPGNYATVLQLMDAFSTFYPGFVAAFEGPNDADEVPVVGGDINELFSAAQFQSQLYGNAHGQGLPAWQLCPSNPNKNQTFGSPPADAANTALYPPYSPNGTGTPFWTGTDTNGYLVDALTAAKATTPSVPVMISNFGWQSYPNGVNNSSPYLVSETTQAAYILETMFSAYKQGASAYIIDELLDVPAGASGVDTGQTYGLFNLVGTQKVSAIALRNLMSTILDITASATAFLPGKLNYTVSNKPGTYGGFINTGYGDLVLQAASGIYYLIMWNEQVLNALNGGPPINVPTVNVSLSFNETAKSNVTVIDPILGAIIAAQNTVSSMTIPLPSYPIIVRVTF